MSPFEYFRPRSLEEAITLLERGVPLAGGTQVSTQRRNVDGVIDLQHLGLTDLRIEENSVVAEAGVTLQDIFATDLRVPEALKSACRQEAGWNVRNAATLGGTILAADGRSPLLTTLLALEAQVSLEPGTQSLSLDALFERRGPAPLGQLLTCVRFQLPQSLAYEQVARSPMDRPLVCVAVARFQSQADETRSTIAIGGFGEHPVRASAAEIELAGNEASDSVLDAAAAAYAHATDAWASAEYRSTVVGVLVGRLLAGGGA